MTRRRFEQRPGWDGGRAPGAGARTEGPTRRKRGVPNRAQASRVKGPLRITTADGEVIEVAPSTATAAARRTVQAGAKRVPRGRAEQQGAVRRRDPRGEL